MKRQIFNNRLTILLILFFNVSLLIAQSNKGYGNKEHIDVKVDNIQTLKITNKHGNISIHGWDKDTISVDMMINVNAPGPNSADEVLKMISIKRANLGEQLLFRTQFDSEFFSNYPFSIEYIVYAPKHINLDVSNSIGDVIIHDLNGQINIVHEYGQLQIQDVQLPDEKAHSLNLGFVKGNIINTGRIKLTTTNSTIKGENLHSLKGTSEYSLFNLKECKVLDLRSETDRISIHHVDSTTLKGAHLISEVKGLTHYGQFEIEQGNLTIQATESLKHLSIANIATQTTIDLPNQISYLLNGEVSDGEFRHPASNQLRIIHEGDTHSFSGKIGSAENTETEIVIFNNGSELIFQLH